MKEDYAGDPQRLAGEKQATLSSTYNVVRSTAESARKAALAALWQNLGKTPAEPQQTPIIDK